MTGHTRRVVTGHAPDGRSVVLADGPVPHRREVPGARFDEVWASSPAPAVLTAGLPEEPTSVAERLGPQGGGSAIRVIDFAPAGEGGVISPMHRTQTLDYGIVIEGEVVLVLSDSEVVLRKGDVAVQRGTDHAWENRSDQWAKMAFVLLDARFDPALAQQIGEQEIMP